MKIFIKLQFRKIREAADKERNLNKLLRAGLASALEFLCHCLSVMPAV